MQSLEGWERRNMLRIEIIEGAVWCWKWVLGGIQGDAKEAFL
jgi:hypothetical protein